MTGGRGGKSADIRLRPMSSLVARTRASSAPMPRMPARPSLSITISTSESLAPSCWRACSTASSTDFAFISRLSNGLSHLGFGCCGTTLDVSTSFLLAFLGAGAAGSGGGKGFVEPGQGTPACDEILHDNANQVGDEPVDGEAAGELGGEEAEHDRHHPRHGGVHLLLAGVLGGHGHHLLLEPHATAHQQRENQARVGEPPGHPEKL